VIFNQFFLFKLGPEFRRDLGLQRLPVLLNLPIASRSDDEGDRDIWRCRELVGRRHVKTLMRRMGIEALYRRPRTLIA
jgi:hypothetical protein